MNNDEIIIDDNKDSDKENKKKLEYCMSCSKIESQVDRLFKFPGGLCICGDCLQDNLDSIGKSYGNLGNMGDMGNLLDYINSLSGKPLSDVSVSEEEDTNNKDDKNKDKGFSNIQMINLSDLQSLMPGNRTKIKKSKDKKDKPVIDINKIIPPHKIKEKLDEYVIGQEQAKKVISVAVYNHYKRVASVQAEDDGVGIEKSNILMLGPTGSGKTYIVKTLAKLLDVPLAITDATTLTEAGYIGDDIESVVSKLIDAADNDVDRAEVGIIFIDEIDKLAKKTSTSTRDVNGESVQQGLLKLLEGSTVEVPVGASNKNMMVPMATVDTSNILFIVGGAFPMMKDIIKERLNKQSSMGFQADLKDKYDDDPNIMNYVTVEDIRKYGMIPEFIGRLPIICTLNSMSEDMLVSVLKEPKNAILKQYQKLLSLDEVDLQFEDDALRAIAKKALKRETGARALRAVIEEIMLDIMYEIPKDDDIGRVIITKEYVEEKGAPKIEMRYLKED